MYFRGILHYCCKTAKSAFMSTNPFQRFKQKESGAKKKEKIRQEKKKVRQETKEYFEQKKKAARQGFIATTSPVEKKSNQDLTPKQFSQSAQNKKADHTPKKNPSLKPQQEPRLQAKDKKTIQKNPPNSKLQSDHLKHPSPTNPENPKHQAPGSMPVNKFIAHAGICSRRDAADVVKSGTVTVNGKLVTEPGFKVTAMDEIKVNGKKITSQKNLVYILLNKPKDFITTTEDPQGRKTVMDIVKSATSERVYPIGRLDRNTTGVLLLTNDGELAQKLSHPSYQIKKIYEVKLDRPLHKKDFETILSGIQLEDGFIAPDVLAYADSKDKSVIGIEIHSGRNRIVRRIFEKLGYDVRNLDRVMYANLTKKNVERGKWRFLQEKEVRLLKYLNASIKKPGNPKQDA
jgi:23S rRNA pseudouridine2605 synthase